MTWFTSILTFGGIFVGIWATIKYVILFELRIDNNTFRTLYELSLKEAVICEFDKNIIRVNSVNQYYPFHYYEKSFLESGETN